MTTSAPQNGGDLYDHGVRVLTIDTATSAAAIGVCSDGVWRNAAPVREPASAQHVLGTIDRLLRDCALELKDLDRIVVGRGPGSFTGLRVGIATAQGLAAPHGIALFGATTTAALRTAAGPAAVAVIDARRGEVFVEGPGIPLAACAPDDLADRLAPGTLLVGDGAVRYRDCFPGCVIPEDASPLHVPDAAALATVAADGEPATPVYARAPDAVPTDQR